MNPIYKAQDRTEWDSEAEATARDAMLAAAEVAREAVEDYWKRVAEAEKTADGQPFDWKKDRYWEVRFAGGPHVEEVSYLYHVRVEMEGGAICLIVPEYHGDRFSGHRSARIRDLYASEDAALVALGQELASVLRQEISRARGRLRESPEALKNLEAQLAAHLGGGVGFPKLARRLVELIEPHVTVQEYAEIDAALRELEVME